MKLRKSGIPKRVVSKVRQRLLEAGKIQPLKQLRELCNNSTLTPQDKAVRAAALLRNIPEEQNGKILK